MVIVDGSKSNIERKDVPRVGLCMPLSTSLMDTTLRCLKIRSQQVDKMELLDRLYLFPSPSTRPAPSRPPRPTPIMSNTQHGRI